MAATSDEIADDGNGRRIGSDLKRRGRSKYNHTILRSSVADVGGNEA
jgi:hypothetical protein